MSTQHSQKLSVNGTSVSKTDESADSEWLDEVFQLLGNSRRRAAIQHILEHERIGNKELTWLVAEEEYGLPREEISSDERHTIYVSLSQTHLPRLEKAGVIEIEGERGSTGDCCTWSSSR